MNAAQFTALRRRAGGFEELLRAAIDARLVPARLEDGTQHAKEVALLAISDRDAGRLEKNLGHTVHASRRHERTVRNVVARYLSS